MATMHSANEKNAKFTWPVPVSDSDLKVLGRAAKVVKARMNDGDTDAATTVRWTRINHLGAKLADLGLEMLQQPDMKLRVDAEEFDTLYRERVADGLREAQLVTQVDERATL